MRGGQTDEDPIAVQFFLRHDRRPVRTPRTPIVELPYAAASFTMLNQKCSMDLMTPRNWFRSTGLVM